MEKMTQAEVKAFNEGYNGGLADARQEADRDFFAAHALQGLLSSEIYMKEIDDTCKKLSATGDEEKTVAAKVVSRTAYFIADAMLVARLLPKTVNQETRNEDSAHPTSPASEKAFHERFAKDNCEAMTEEQWGVWVDALPKDEFWSMMNLGLNEKQPRESV